MERISLNGRAVPGFALSQASPDTVKFAVTPGRRGRGGGSRRRTLGRRPPRPLVGQHRRRLRRSALHEGRHRQGRREDGLNQLIDDPLDESVGTLSTLRALLELQHDLHGIR